MDSLWRAAVASSADPSCLDGPAAVSFFQRSGLPASTLARVWQLSVEKGNDAALDRAGFERAMRYIAMAQSQLGQPGQPGQPLNLAVEEMKALPESTLPRIEGFRAPSQTLSASAEPTLLQLPAVADADLVRYSQYFDARMSSPDDDFLDGDKAREVFLKSQLPLPVLARIWTLSDPSNRGRLSRAEFATAMHLVREAMAVPTTLAALQLPAAILLPENYIKEVALAMGIDHKGKAPVQRRRDSIMQDIPWSITVDEKTRSDAWFRQIDASNKLYLTGQEAAAFFLRSKLPEIQLAQIWDLADVQKQGKLNADQFAVAMHLIQDAVHGNPIPGALPRSMIPPALRQPLDAPTSAPAPIPTFIDDPFAAADPFRITPLLHSSSFGSASLSRSVTRNYTAPLNATRSPLLNDPFHGLFGEGHTVSSPPKAASAFPEPLVNTPPTSRGPPQSIRNAHASILDLFETPAANPPMESSASSIKSRSDAKQSDAADSHSAVREKHAEIQAMSDSIVAATRDTAESARQRALLESQLASLNTQRRDLSIRVAQAQSAASREKQLLEETRRAIDKEELELRADEAALVTLDEEAGRARRDRMELEHRLEQVKEQRGHIQARIEVARNSTTSWRLEREGALLEIGQEEARLQAEEGRLRLAERAVTDKATSSVPASAQKTKPFWEAFDDEDEFVQVPASSKSAVGSGGSRTKMGNADFDFSAALASAAKQQDGTVTVAPEDEFDRAFAALNVTEGATTTLIDDDDVDFDFDTETFAHHTLASGRTSGSAGGLMQSVDSEVAGDAAMRFPDIDSLRGSETALAGAVSQDKKVKVEEVQDEGSD